MPQSPKPFSSEWIQAPAPGPQRPRRWSADAQARVLRFFRHFPGDRTLSFLVVAGLIMASFWFTGPGHVVEYQAGTDLVAHVPETPEIQFAVPRPTVEPDISTDSLQVTDNPDPATDQTGVGAAVLPDLQLQPASRDEEPTTLGGILPDNRVLSFYGFPGNPQMGILGEYDMQRLLELLREQAAAYEEADPSRPVVLAFEVIASVAQKDPQADGSYLLDTPSSVLDEYADFTRENGLLLILDAQIGYRTVENDVKGLRPWLEQEHVHLALDPEFAMDDGQIPGEHIGSIDAVDVAWAQQWLVDLTLEAAISPKILIVHQFKESMITNKDQIIPMTGVQLVIDADGWGPPELKKSTYEFVNNVTQVEYAGVKLFYRQDVPLMTAEDIVNLDPSPLFVMYQ
jgi:hypothetical protein